MRTDPRYSNTSSHSEHISRSGLASLLSTDGSYLASVAGHYLALVFCASSVTPDRFRAFLALHSLAGTVLDATPQLIESQALAHQLFSRLPRTAAKQLVPVFPELLDEVTRSWRDRPYSSRSPIPGASSLDCEAMESLGLLRMPPMEPLVAAHLHPQLSAMSSRSPSLPSKSDRFQSALTEKTYKSAALSARALNVLSLLTSLHSTQAGVQAGSRGRQIDASEVCSEACIP